MPIVINSVKKGSIAYHLGIKAGDGLVSINDNRINDLLDFMFYTAEKRIIVCIEGKKGGLRSYTISKEEDEDIGLNFSSFLMDSQRNCQNNCIFCFIDQNPPGMRETIYEKDDDERLSFLFGNYLTLTNLDEKLISRLIEFKVSPLNLSIHSTNPCLLTRIVNNKNAKKTIEKMKRLSEAGIRLNCQIVLCKDVNDKEELKQTLLDLIGMYPSVQSISIVPAGLTSYRSNLYVLKDFTKEDAQEIVATAESLYIQCREKYGTGLVYASDEWYIRAGIDIPKVHYYGEFHQIENGVGMIALFEEETNEGLKGYSKLSSYNEIITGEMAYEWMSCLLETIHFKHPEIRYRVHKVKNDFFGGNVAVAGLVTARDIMNQVKPEDIVGNRILIPSSMLRSEQDMFLDNVLLSELATYYQKEILVISNGYEFADALGNMEY